MNMKPKVKPKFAVTARSFILLLIVIQLGISGVSSEGVELCDCDPDLPPMPSMETVTDPCEIPPIDPDIRPPVDPGTRPPFPPVPPIPPIPPVPPSIIRHPANCAIIGESPNMLLWPTVRTAKSYDVYLGKSDTFTESDFKGSVSDTILAIDHELEPGTTYNWRVDVVTSEKVYEGIPWIFYVAMNAQSPYPASGIGGVKLPLLQWTSDPNVVSQNLYLGTTADLTEENLVAQLQEDFYFIPFDEQLGPGGELGMQPNTNYRWRVDGVLENGTIVSGDVWNFTTEAETPTFEYEKPAAWWTFDEYAGPVAKDAVGTRVGFIEGALWDLDVDDPNRTSAALRFDGIDDWVEIYDVEGLFEESFSVSCWIRGGDNGQVIVSQRDGANWLMVSRDFPGLQTELTDPALASDAFVFPAGWDHVCVVWDADQGQVALYMNGERLNSQDGVGDLPIIPDSPLYIGCGSDQSPESFWNGVIDEVEIFDRALTIGDLESLVTRQVHIETDRYYTDVSRYKHLRIDLNYDKALSAVLSRQAVDATDEQIADFANSLGLGVVKIDRPNRIVELELPLPFPISRLQATEFTRAARRVLGDDSLFVEIGLAVTPGAAKTSILVNEQFTVYLGPGASIGDFLEDGRASEVMRNPFEPNEYLLEVTAMSGKDALALANEYHLNPNTRYAVPNLAIVPHYRGQFVQWHLDDTISDADIDANEAWDFSEGEGVVIAVIDSGFDVGHADLKDNIAFQDPSIQVDPHGTAVAGCISANGIVFGSCPKAQLILLPCNITTFDQHVAFDSARDKGADVICCSWGYEAEIAAPNDVKDAIFRTTSLGRVKTLDTAFGDVNVPFGCAVLFAMTNEPNDNGGYFPDISSLERVIAVSGSTDQDKCSGAGYGNIMEVLAPTGGGIRRIVTTDVRGSAGYNYEWADPSLDCNDVGSPLEYTRCFGGTSAACATTAGVAGLIMSLEPQLELTRPGEPYLWWWEVRRLLQDTADKIEPLVANYSETDGFSRGLNGTATHGYGRVNAYEATRIIKRGGVDVFLRDNLLDWGNTEQPSSTRFENPRDFIAYWESPDIEIDGSKVKVRVRNRGPVMATSVTVILFGCLMEGTEPPDLPAGFWTPFPDGPFVGNANWMLWGEPSQVEEILYSGPSRANPPVTTAVFDMPDELQSGDYCLLAIAYSPDDPVRDKWKEENLVDLDEITPNDNNITQRFVQIERP